MTEIYCIHSANIFVKLYEYNLFYARSLAKNMKQIIIRQYLMALKVYRMNRFISEVSLTFGLYITL